MAKREVNAAFGSLKELLSGDADFVREAVREYLQDVLEEEMTAALGAAKGERSMVRLGYRSGYYERARSWPPTLNPPRIGPTEFQDPSSNCLIRDVETTLGKQVLNVPIAQRETAIEPDGMLDDDRWKAVTTIGYLAHPETLKHRPCRSHGVNVTMPTGMLPATQGFGRRPWQFAGASSRRGLEGGGRASRADCEDRLARHGTIGSHRR